MRKLFLLFWALLATTCLWAHDFEVDGIFYDILDEKSVAVTYEGSYSSQYDDEYFGEVTIPETVTYNGTTYSVTSIGPYAFEYCSSLTSITIPNNVTSIGFSSFYECYALTSVTIPNSVTLIGYMAFYDCSSLASITIPNSVTSIGGNAFYDCYALASVTIPNSVTSIGERAFQNCSSLSLVTLTAPSVEAFCNGQGNNLLRNAGCHASRKIAINGEIITSITIPNSVTSIGESAFQYCDDLTSVTIGNSVTSIGDYAFSSCSSLTSITIGNNVTSIGSYAFQYCSSLTSVSLPDGLTRIGDDAFRSCSSLTSVSLPDGLTRIGDDAFRSCSSLTSITIPNSVTSIGDEAFYSCSSLTSITIGNSVTSIGSYAFDYCSSLTSVTIPNSVTSIGYGAFSSCSSLTSITISNSVTSIGNYAFQNCSSLTSITLPNSVTSIGERTFYGCSSLTSITCLGITPPNASDLGANATKCTLTVPHSAYNAYLRHTYWGSFLNINTGYWVTLQANNDQWGEVTGTGLYAQEATITATPNDGYTFMRWSDGNTDNPRTIQVTSDTTLTAEFDVDTRRLVTFVDWDGTVLSSVSVVSGEAAIAPADPIREGYTFIGWDKDFSAVTDHMTVTAQYQINRYRVRFFDDDTLLKTDSVEYQSAAIAPANPYHEGYTFTGWDQAFDSITSDLDVYAMYEMGEDRDMTIVFTNGNDDSEVLSQSITIKIPAAPEIAGFTFLGWKATDAFISDVITIQAIYEADVPSSAPEEYINPANPAQKLLRNGQVYILQDGKTYTIMGAEIQ